MRYEDWGRPSLTLLALLSLAFMGSAGCGSGSGQTSGELVGGIIYPHDDSYALTQTSDPLFAVAGCDEGLRELPSSVDLRREGIIPPVQNQRWNSCVAWALGYYLMTAVEARQLGGACGLDLSNPAHWFSPDFLYSQRDSREARQLVAPLDPICDETDGDLGCMRPEKALQTLLNQGCAKWTWMCRGGMPPVGGVPNDAPEQSGVAAYRSCAPDDFALETLRSRRLFAPAQDAAAAFTPRCHIRFGALEDRTRVPIADMQGWLAEKKTPIAIVVDMADGWIRYQARNRKSVLIRRGFVADIVDERDACFDAIGTGVLGSQHMMTIIGYDDQYPSRAYYPNMPEEKTGSFLVINQWGTKWGDQGLMWIPYAELEKIWVAGYALDLAPRGSVRCRQIEGNPNRVGDGRVQVKEVDDVPENIVDGIRTITATPLPVPAIGAVTLRSGLCGGFQTEGDVDTADWYYFVTTEPVWVDLGLGALVDDLHLKLTNRDQGRLATSANTGATDEQIVRQLCEPGTYFVKVYQGFGGGGTALPYDLTLKLVAPGAIEADNDICGAVPIAIGGSALHRKPALQISRVGEGDVGGENDPCDWLRVDATTTSTLEVLLEGQGVVVDAWRGRTPDSATLVARSVRPHADWFFAHLSLAARAGQRFYFRVRPEVPGEEASYLFFVKAVPSPAPDDGPGGAIALKLAPEPVAAGEATRRCVASINAALDGDEDALDFYKVLAPPFTPVSVTLSKVDGPATLYLTTFGDPPVTVDGVDSDDNATGNEIMTQVPGTGELLLVVGTLDGLPGSYRLAVVAECNEDPAIDGPATQRTIMADGGLTTGLVGGNDLEDWYRLQVPGRGQGSLLVCLTAAAGPLAFDVMADPTGAALPSAPLPNRKLFASSFVTSKRVELPEQVGTLWIRIDGALAGGLTDYTLSLEGERLPRGMEGKDSPSLATRIALNEEHKSDLGAADPYDYYRLSIPEAGRYRFSLIEQSLGVVRIWSDDGTKLLEQNFSTFPFHEFDVPEATELTIRLDTMITMSFTAESCLRFTVTREEPGN